MGRSSEIFADAQIFIRQAFGKSSKKAKKAKVMLSLPSQIRHN
jgi:hypothetical protein